MSVTRRREQLLQELMDFQKVLEERLETQDRMIKRFQMLIANDVLFFQIIDYFPYPVAVFTQMRQLVAANKAFITETSLCKIELEKGTYSILRMKSIDNYQIYKAVEQVFSGQTTFINELNNPLSLFFEYEQQFKTPLTLYKNAAFFPVSDDFDFITHGVAVFLK